MNDDIGEWETDQMIKGGLKPKKQKLIKPKIPNIQKLPSYLEKLSLIESNLAVLSSNVKLLEQEHDIKNEQIKNCKIEIKSLEAINQQDAEKYNFFKEFQIFCNNFADMLNEKIPLLETLENEYIQSFKNPALDNSINQDLYDSFFIDVDPDFTSLHYILTKFFSRWRNIYSIDYESAYGLLTVPSIAEIFIRFEISCVDFLSFAIKLSSFNWFKDITSFDSKLLLKVIEKFVLPRLDCLIENNFEFDNKTRNLISVYMDINEYCKNSLVYSESISKLVVSLKNRVSKLISNEFSESEIFLENISFWNGIISTEIILQIVIELIEYKCLVDVLNKIKSFGVSNADFKLVYQIIRFIPDECLKVYSDCYSTPAAFGGICKLLEEFSGYIQAVEDVNEAVDDLGKSLVLIYAYNQASVVEKMRN